MKQTLQLNYVAFGDSITNGYKASSDEMNWVSLLTNRLNEESTSITINKINSGIPGNKSYDLLERIEEDVLAHNPDIVTIMCGTNDIRWVRSIEEYSTNMGEIIDRIRKECLNAKIYLATPPYMTAFKDGSRELQLQFNEHIVELAKVKEVTLVDIFAVTDGKDETLDPDGFHPNNYGHQVMAEHWFSIINGSVIKC